MEDIRLVTFDLDDTLWAIRPVIERAEKLLHQWLLQTWPEAGHRFNPAALRALRLEVEDLHPELAGDLSALRRESIRLALARCNGPVERCEEGFQVFWKARNRVEFYEDVLPALRRLNQRFTLAAISNGNACLERTGLTSYMEFGLSAGTTGSLKPAPDMFLQACASAGVDPSQALHVGDDLECDVAGATNAGMRAAWINRENLKQELPENAIEIRNLHALTEKLAA